MNQLVVSHHIVSKHKNKIIFLFNIYPLLALVQIVETVTTPYTETTYTDCGTCLGVPEPSTPIEGFCKCYSPQYWNGQECVSRNQCPCMVGHISYDVGAKYETEDCQKCVCVLGGVSQCKPQQCPPCKKGLRPVKTATCMCVCEACPEFTMLCPSSGACVRESAWCDGIQDCPDDEINCEKKKEQVEVEKTIEKTISKYLFCTIQ